LSVASIVNSFEESELSRVKGSGWVKRSTQILNGHMRVSLNISIDNSLRSSKVGSIGVGKEPCIKVGRLDGDIEGGIGLDCGTSRYRESDNGRNHVSFRRNLTHWNSIAGASGDLESIGECRSRANVDEVVGRGGGRSLANLSGTNLLGTIHKRTALNSICIQSEAVT
jgi:hypothetical protein